jgi:hypothetical protein
MSVSPPIRPRANSYLNDPPAEPTDFPSGSILLNGPNSSSARDPSPRPSLTPSEQSQESVATRASVQSVSFAPLPVIPPELKRRNSITLGVAARKNLLSSPADNMYPNPGGKKADPNGIQKVYMNDADWEEYKRHHDEKNGSVNLVFLLDQKEPKLMSSNDVPDLGDLVTNGAKNLWRKVRSSPRSENLGTSPTPSTSSINSAATNSCNNNSRIGSSPSAGNSLLSNLTSPRVAMRRRGGSDPSAPLPNPNTMTKQPDLPDVEEEALSRMQSAEAPINHHSTSPGLSSQIMDWHKNQTSAVAEGEQHHPRHASPPPRVQDVVPSQDEVYDNDSQGQGVQETIVEEMEMEDDLEGGGALGLEKVDIRSEAGDVPEWKQDWTSSNSGANKRDSEVLGFDRRRFGAGN